METTQKPSESLSLNDTHLLAEYLAAQGDPIAFAKAANLKLQDALKWAFSPQINNTLKQLQEMQETAFVAAATAAKCTCIEILSTTMAQIVDFHDKHKDDPALRTKSSARFGTLLRALSLLARVSGLKLPTPAAIARSTTKSSPNDPTSPHTSPPNPPPNASTQTPTLNSPPTPSVHSQSTPTTHSNPLPFSGRESPPPVTQLFNACGGARALNPPSPTPSSPPLRTTARVNRST